MDLSQKLTRIVLGIIALIPVAFISYYVMVFGVNVPYLAEWDFVLDVNDYINGEMTLEKLWAQTGDHRPFIPKVFMLLIAGWTGWNIIAQLYVNVLLGVILLGVTYVLLKMSSSLFEKDSLKYVVVALTYVVFSPLQLEVYLWGLGCQLLLMNIFVVLGVISLTQPEMKFRHLFAGCFFGFCAASSFLAGHAFWVVGFLIIMIKNIKADRKLVCLFAWFGLTVASVYLYFKGYVYYTHHAEHAFLTEDPARAAVRFFFECIGAVVGDTTHSALIFGIYGAVVFFLLSVSLGVRYVDHINDLSRLIGLGFFGFCAAVFSISGVGKDVGTAIDSRYFPASISLWVAVIALSTIFIVLSFKKGEHRGGVKWVFYTLGCLLFVASIYVFFNYVKAGERAIPEWTNHHRKTSIAHSNIRKLKLTEAVNRVMEREDQLERIIVLKGNKLSLFKDEA